MWTQMNGTRRPHLGEAVGAAGDRLGLPPLSTCRTKVAGSLHPGVTVRPWVSFTSHAPPSHPHGTGGGTGGWAVTGS